MSKYTTQEIVQVIELTKCKLDILKLKSANGGYDWSHVDEPTRQQLESLVPEIDSILTHIRESVNARPF